MPETVADLIALLSEMPQDAKLLVFESDYEGICEFPYHNGVMPLYDEELHAAVF